MALTSFLADRRSVRRIVLATILSVAASFGPAPGFAQPPAEDATVRVAWSAPEGCGSADAMTAEIRRLLGPDTPPTSEAIAVAARITERQGGGFVLELVLDLPDGSATRALDGASCDVLVQAGALVVALAIDPEGVVSRAVEAARAPPPEVVAPAETPAPTVEAAGPTEATATVPRPSPPEGEESEPVTRLRERTIFGIVSVAASADVGTLPGSTVGVEGGGGVRVGRVEAIASIRWLAERRAALATRPTAGGAFDLVAVRARGCYVPPLRSWIEIAPCVAVETGTLRGRGYGVTEPGSGAAPWLALGAGALARLRPVKHVGVDLRAEATVPVLRSRYVLEGLGPVHRAAAAGFYATIGLTAHFP